jgi:MFS family permease
VPTTTRVLRGYYAIAGLYTLSASLIWGVNTLFLLDAGLDIFEVFVANAAFSLGTVLFEIPTGVIADTFGRRVSFLASVAVLAVSTALYVGLDAAGGGVLAFSVVSLFTGLGFTFYSGAVEAWLVDALNASGFAGDLDRVFARGQMVSGAAMLVGTVGGGLLGQIDLAIPYIVRVVALGALFVLALAVMHDVGFEPRRVAVSRLPGEMRRVASDSIRFGWERRPIRLMMLTGFVQMGFLMWGFYAWQPYFLELLDRDAVWVAGLFSALIAVSTMVGNGVVEWLTRFCGRRTTLLLWAAAVSAVAAVIVGLAGTFWLAAGAFLLITGAMGVASPVRQSYLHQLIPAAQRATVISFDSMVGGTGGVAGQVGLGALAESRSISAGYVVGGFWSLLTVPLLLVVRRMGTEADRIVGRCGVEGTCAAQGLPDIATVQSRGRDEFAVLPTGSDPDDI